jgi:hypothetical protein
VDGEQVGWTRERFDGYPCTPAEARDQRRSLLVDWLRAIAEDPQSGVGRMMGDSPGRSALSWARRTVADVRAAVVESQLPFVVRCDRRVKPRWIEVEARR